MTKTTLNITGMACNMCEAHVNDAIRENFKVKKVNSSHTKNQTEIISEEPLDEAKLKDVIAETGYELQGISSEPYVCQERLVRLREIGSLTRRSAELCALAAARCFSSPALLLPRCLANLARAFME